jgi:predicted RNA binding protein YcfA (HicA-like mRNA interferase family)
MSRRLPAVTGRQTVRALERAGFVLARIKGSHHVMEHPQHPMRTTTVPLHGTKTLRKGTLRSILNQAGLTVDEFLDLL